MIGSEIFGRAAEEQVQSGCIHQQFGRLCRRCRRHDVSLLNLQSHSCLPQSLFTEVTPLSQRSTGASMVDPRSFHLES